MNIKRQKRGEKETYMLFTKDIVTRVSDFMEVIFIQLSNETCKI